MTLATLQRFLRLCLGLWLLASAAAVRADEALALRTLLDYGRGYTDAVMEQQPSRPAPPPAGVKPRRIMLRGGVLEVSGLVGEEGAWASRLDLREMHFNLLDVNTGSTTPEGLQSLLGKPARIVRDGQGVVRLVYSGYLEICSETLSFSFVAGVLSQVSWIWCTD